MDFKEMTVEELEERKSAIPTELDEESADLDALEEEVKGINAELETRKEAEAKREEIRAEVANGKGVVLAATEEIKETDNMSNTEMRSSKEYKDAYGEFIKKNYDLNKLNEEMRALLTTNAEEDGMIAVPTGVDDRIRTAWENDEIMSRITRTFFKGNLKVGHEASAGPAVFHGEGADAVEPEDLSIVYTELVPAMIKKVVEVSDEVLAINGTLVDYLYDEVEYQIVKLASKTAIGKIIASTLTESYTLAGATPTTVDIVKATGKLSGEATNPVLITTRATAADIRLPRLRRTSPTIRSTDCLSFTRTPRLLTVLPLSSLTCRAFRRTSPRVTARSLSSTSLRRLTRISSVSSVVCMLVSTLSHRARPLRQFRKRASLNYSLEFGY